MSHRIYTTPGFVIESRPYAEAGKTLSIFTRDLGMVNAAAQGIRLAKSKLRYHAQDFSLSEFSLVRGRDLWRIVGAEKDISDTGTGNAGAHALDPLFIRVLTVLRRLVQGEEKNEALFAAILAAHDFFKNVGPNTATKAASNAVEPVIMLRILNHLGYIRTKPKLEVFLADDSFAPELLEKMSVPGTRVLAITEINKALQESHL